MSDLKKYIEKRKALDKVFAENYEEGYHDFKTGVMVREARRQAEKLWKHNDKNGR